MGKGRKGQGKGRKAAAAGSVSRPVAVAADAGARRRQLLLVFGLFFGSGAVGLMYELSWVKAITLVFGSTTLAVSTVVSIYMGGLALGAALAGRRADRLERPLTWYGRIEVCLALYAFATPVLFGVLLPWLGGLASAGGIWVLSLFRFVTSAALLLPPTLLMGATLPVLARFYVTRLGDGGRGAGLLYGANTVGAFAGTFCAGFGLLPSLGVTTTVLLVAGLNLLLGLVGFGVGRAVEGPAPAGPAEADAGAPAPAEASARPPAAALAAVALTGFASLACEVAWSRILAMQLGGSVYAFTIVLGTFLAALGLGAALTAAFLRGAPQHARLVFYALGLGSALLVSVSFGVCGRLPALLLELYYGWQFEQDPGAFFRAQLLFAGAVVFVPTLLMGGLFAAALKVTVSDAARVAASVSWLYGANTLGSVLGSFLSGFVLVPALGLRGTLVVAMLAQCLGAGALAHAPEAPGRSRKLWAGAGGLALALVLLTPSWAPLLMSSGIYRDATLFKASDASRLEEQLAAKYDLIYYRDGLTSTITVIANRKSGQLSIATNGKTDGSSVADMPTQRLLAHVPLLIHPDPQRTCIVGLGTGCTLGSASLYPQEEVVALEIEPAMVEGARLFAEHNHRVLEAGSRARVEVTDGRLFLQLQPERYDVIISEPSNPWLAGVSHLFTREFYAIGARALRPGGVFAQWFELYGLRPELLRTALRTFRTAFAYVYVFSALHDADLVVLGSQQPLRFDLGQLEARLRAHPAVADDMRDPRVRVRSAVELLSRFCMGPDELGGFVGEGPLHTDDRPLISYEAPQDNFRDTVPLNLQELSHHARGVAHYLEGLPEAKPDALRVWRVLAACYRNFAGRGPEEAAAEERALALAPETPPFAFDPEEANVLSKRGFDLAQDGELAQALALLERAHALDPSHPGVALNLSRVLHDLGRLDEALAAAEWGVRLDPRHGLAYWHRARARDSLAQLDEALADYARALELDPGQAAVRVLMARILEARGDVAGARGQLDRYLQEHPDDAHARERRAALGE